MPRKCSVFACKTNYRNQQDKTMRGEIYKIPLYRFPKKKDKRERERERERERAMDKISSKYQSKCY